jgi:hypothetical protein
MSAAQVQELHGVTKVAATGASAFDAVANIPACDDNPLGE